MRKKADALFEQVGLTPWKDNGAANRSVGQQQRVAIARALAMNPALVLTDEPTGNLDGKSADVVFDLMGKVTQGNGTTFLIVAHNVDVVKCTDRIVEVVDSRIV